MDASASIDKSAATLQRDGHVKALRSPDIVAAIGRNRIGCIAISYFEWSSNGRSRLLLPWTTVCNRADADAAATVIADVGNTGMGRTQGQTSISFAIDFARELLDSFPGETTRKIIDISANGSNNDGPSIEHSKSRAVARSYTINAIAVPAKLRGVQYDIAPYLAENVIGGPGAFVITPVDEADYAAALRRKMVVEVAELDQYQGDGR